MTCVHLQKLYQLCIDNKIKMSGSDLVRIVCEECGIQESCPSVLIDEYDQKEASGQQTVANQQAMQPGQGATDAPNNAC